MNMDIERLIKIAIESRKKAYAPYSKFLVGAALLTKSGTIFAGTNIENASLGLTICAERVAIFKAICQGEKDFEAIAIATDSENLISPCGACLQVMMEFAPELKVILANLKGKSEIKKLKDLLPEAFRKF